LLLGCLLRWPRATQRRENGCSGRGIGPSACWGLLGRRCGKLDDMDRDQANKLLEYAERIAIALERIATQLEAGPKFKETMDKRTYQTIGDFARKIADSQK
jgi:hypothetical protein